MYCNQTPFPPGEGWGLGMRLFVVSTQTLLLSKQVQTIVAGRQCDTQTIEFRSLYTSGKAYGNLVLQATLPGVKKLRVWLVLFLENVLHYSGRSNPAEEIRFLEVFF